MSPLLTDTGADCIEFSIWDMSVFGSEGEGEGGREEGRGIDPCHRLFLFADWVIYVLSFDMTKLEELEDVHSWLNILGAWMCGWEGEGGKGGSCMSVRRIWRKREEFMLDFSLSHTLSLSSRYLRTQLTSPYLRDELGGQNVHRRICEEHI